MTSLRFPLFEAQTMKLTGRYNSVASRDQSYVVTENLLLGSVSLICLAKLSEGFDGDLPSIYALQH